MSVSRKVALVLSTGLMVVSLAACHKEGPAERAGKSIDQAVEKAGDKIKDATDKTGDKLEEAERKIKKSMK